MALAAINVKKTRGAQISTNHEESRQKKHLQQMENRTKITAQTVSAFLMLLSGVALNVASFAVPPVGELSNSVMTYMGEALIYAASVFGLTVYVNSCMARLERRVGKDDRTDSRRDGEGNEEDSG